MSDSVVFTRRDFLKLVGIGVAGAATGCAKPPGEKLIPYLVAPEDVTPGVPYFYASTCRECPAGCGIVVKAREGRAIKIEGNPEHPIGHGGLCARGQAGLQGLYDPDRVKTPLVRQGKEWKAIGWDEALTSIATKLGEAKAGAAKLAVLSGHETGSFQRLQSEWTKAAGGELLLWEPFALESVREANRRTFGIAAVPHYDFARARCVVSFGADFLETFGSPTDQARGFAAMRAKRDDGAGHFVTVEPRLSLTGANADEWIAAKPGSEAALALGMANVIVSDGLGAAGAGGARDAVASWTPEAVERATEVPADTVRRLARRFASSRPSLAIAGGIAAQSENAVALVAAVNLLNWVAGNIGETVRFDRTLNYDAVGSFADLQRLVSSMDAGGVGVLVVHGANPVYATPAWAGFAAAMDKVPFKVALSSVLDETAERCDIVLPISHPLETLGDAQPARGVWSIQQAAMRPLPMFDARPAGDVLIAIAKAGSFGSFPDAWSDYVQARWRELLPAHGAGRDWQAFWTESLRRGGVWTDVTAPAVGWKSGVEFTLPQLKGGGDFALVMPPSNALYDGRGANKAWLQELPDMVSKAVWGSWVELHPDAAKKLGVESGDPVRVTTEQGSLELPAYVYAGIRPDTIAIALGQGHTASGRYAQGRGVNPLALLPAAQDGASGAVAYLSTTARLARGTKAMALSLQQREKNQHGRGIAQVIPVAVLLAGGTAGGHGAAAGEGAAAGHGATADAHGAGGAAERVAGRGYPGHYPAGAGVHVEPHPSQTRPGKYTEPMARPADVPPPAHSVSAFEPKEKVRTARQNPVNIGSYANAKHRWAMSIDLNSCTGCAACVVACNAENNIPVVGPELMARGREMNWIRIDRFEERVAPGAVDVRFVPMMCQHCGDAPCELVCPVYATYHNPEGLNAQVYNRCVGTRYCSNNCPYKVRAFNFFEYASPEKTTFAFPTPLNWQLNPDVTVRSKGVMEKCTMCIQRILEGKGTAKDEGREIRDGEIQTACAQTCPTQAITFGDLIDPESEVHLRSYGERRYWVLEELNTKPGVTYLQKIQRETA